MPKKIFIVIILIAAVIGGVYFLRYSKGSSVTNQASPTAASTGTQNVIVANFAFSPVALEVAKGDTVVWINQDSAPHQITGDGFESEVLGREKSFSFTFNTIGAFDYYCNLHPYMKGKIIVK